MRINRLIGTCLVVITILLAFATLRPMFSPDAVRAQSHYEYQLVRVERDEAAAKVSTLTKQGWEPVAMSFYYEGSPGTTIGCLLFRR